MTMTDHSACGAAEHDRSLPDLDPDDVPVAEDGLLGCPDCGRPVFYCTNAEDYAHVDPNAECWLHRAWGASEDD